MEESKLKFDFQNEKKGEKLQKKIKNNSKEKYKKRRNDNGVKTMEKPKTTSTGKTKANLPAKFK